MSSNESVREVRVKPGRLGDTQGVIDVRVIDPIVAGVDETLSYAERGLRNASLNTKNHQ